MQASPRPFTRRAFLRTTAASLATVSFIPSSVLGRPGATPPSNRLNLACIGVGGRGGANLKELSSENIVGLCDVDESTLNEARARFPKAKPYRDFRVMLDALDQEIDGVVVSTPDHTHAVAAMRAIKMRKHVYCEKPLAHAIGEVRALVAAAKRYGVVTQLGNQGHSSDSIRKFCEWIWDGAIGTVREVHAWCGSDYSRLRQLERVKSPVAVPAELDWDLWLGPLSYRPYHPAYAPRLWRGWLDFGTGVIGDWTCHVIDPVFWALDLYAPSSIVTGEFDYDPGQQGASYPSGVVLHYEFPANSKRPPVKLTWSDGGKKPPRPSELPADESLPQIGALVVGDQGKILYGSHGAGKAQILPEERMEAFKQPQRRLARVASHHRDWTEACKAGRPAGSHFNYGGLLTEIALLGIIAIRLKGQQLEWNSRKMLFTNSNDANYLLYAPYREGWRL